MAAAEWYGDRRANEPDKEYAERTRAGAGNFVRSAAVRAEIAVPLIFDGMLRGVLDVDSHQLAPFVDADRSFLENVGDLVALRLSLSRF